MQVIIFETCIPSLPSPAAISFDGSINRFIYEQGMPASCFVMIVDTLCMSKGKIEFMMNVDGVL